MVNPNQLACCPFQPGIEDPVAQRQVLSGPEKLVYASRPAPQASELAIPEFNQNGINEAGRILEPETMRPRPSELSPPWGIWMSSGLLQVVLSGPAILHSSRCLFHKQADITGRRTWRLGPSMLHQGPWHPGSRDVPGDAACVCLYPLNHPTLICSRCICQKAIGGGTGALMA